MSVIPVFGGRLPCVCVFESTRHNACSSRILCILCSSCTLTLCTLCSSSAALIFISASRMLSQSSSMALPLGDFFLPIASAICSAVSALLPLLCSPPVSADSAAAESAAADSAAVVSAAAADSAAAVSMSLPRYVETSQLYQVYSA
jgi:hypothetical protein